MGLTIKTVPESALEWAADRSVVMPGIALAPTSENMPHIKKFEVDIAGRSTPLDKQTEMDRLAEKLKLAYPKLEYKVGKEVPLRQQMSLPLNRVSLEGPIPPSARFTLTIQVWYFDSDAQGRANTSGGLKGPVKATVVLTAAPQVTVHAVPVQPLGPCRIELEPAHLSLVDRGAPAVLTVRVANRPADVSPRLLLVEALTDAPELGSTLATLLAGGLKRAEDAGAGGWETWRAELALQLEPEARRSLADRSLGRSLEVAARVEVPAKAVTELTLRLLCQEDVFKGLMAIDFGTSNSTVTLYDPGVVEDLTGLAPEQETRLKELLLTELMNDDCSCKLPDADPQAWQALIERVGGNLPGEGPPAGRFKAALRAGGARMFEAVRQLEICLGARPIKAAVFRALNRIYHEAFLEPRLKSQSLVAIPLDPNFPQERDIPSELEIKGPGTPLQVILGRRAQQDRRAAMALTGDGPEKGSDPLRSRGQTPFPDREEPPHQSLDTIRRRFHHSPKRYLGIRKTLSVPLGGDMVSLTTDQLVQAALGSLVELTDHWRGRNPTACSKGRFTRAVVTYPTVAPPSVRREVENLVRELKFPDVVTDYDEAVAAALFYLHREFGGSLDLGPEVFKSRSRRDNNKWFQNVLVLDIGGGSTDLALLQLTLEEVDPFLPGENRGAGGRCYVISPRLLGSSGNTQLGGELITLRLFRLLKAALADRLLTAVQDKHLESAGITGKIAQLGEAFVDNNGKYRPGSILGPVAELPDTDPLFTDALNAAEQVLPTRWRNNPGRLQAFYTLWEQAETAKIKLGGRREPGTEAPTFELSDPDISALLGQCGIAHTIKDAGALRVSLDAGHFERAAEPIIQEAVGIARGLLAGRLPHRLTEPSSPEEGDTGSVQEPLDWLILSGKTCNLDLVHQIVRQEFINSPHFVWNPERVTFVPQYAKLAPSAGACYAEKMRRTAFAPARFKEQLRRGLNQLTYNIDNLFFFLPCSFLVPVHNGQIEIFKGGQPLYRLDEQEVGKARSEPIGVRLLNAVMRRDFQTATPILWGSFDGMALARELQMQVPVFLNRIMMQFEVDYRLFMRIYLWDGPAPHYQIDPQSPFVDVADRMRQRAAGMAPPHPALSPAGAEGKEKPSLPAGGEGRVRGAVPEAPARTRPDGNGKAGWDISVDVILAQANSRPPTALIAADKPVQETFHYNGEAFARGLITPLPDLFDQAGVLTVHARQPGTGEWVHVGELSRPVDLRPTHAGLERVTEYPRRYYLTLDEHGVLRVHLGEVPYWKTEDLLDWKDRPGRVLQRDLELVEPPPRENRDPFCGAH
jgi:hypothetical protein